MGRVCVCHAVMEASAGAASSLIIGHGLVFQLVLPTSVQSGLTITTPDSISGVTGLVLKGRDAVPGKAGHQRAACTLTPAAANC